MTRNPTLLLAAVLTLMTSSALAQERVWVVDAAGGADFTEIADALPLTGEGWAVVVRPGTYTEPVVIANQGLTLVADGGPVVLTEPLTVQGLGLTRDLILSGLELREGFSVTGCNGLVRFQDCLVPQPTTPGAEPAGSMYWEWPECGFGHSRQVVSGCRGVTFVDCEFHGADGETLIWDGTPGHHGLLVEDSGVALYGCTLTGGEGAPASSSGHFPVVGGAGGDGLRVKGRDSSVRTCDLTALGGGGGTFVPGGNGSFGVTFGCDGTDMRVDMGSAAEACAHPALSLEAPPILRGNQVAALQIEAPVGAPVFLIASNEPFWRPLPAAIGILHLAQPLSFQNLGVTPGSGVLDVPFSDPGPALANGMVSLQFQVFAVQNGARFLSPPRRTIVLDPSL